MFFLNCPFDDQYKPIFEALLFAIHACGFTARCAKEYSGSETSRIRRIVEIIQDCEFGIHDLSRVDTPIPRFNMPLELGIFIGARDFGDEQQKRKKFLVLEGEPNAYDQFISDISGQDVSNHNNVPKDAVNAVRQWLSDQNTTDAVVPGRDRIMLLYHQFSAMLPGILEFSGQDEASMTFKELRKYVQDFIDAQVPGPPIAPGL